MTFVVNLRRGARALALGAFLAGISAVSGVPALAQDDPVVAVINGEKIMRSDLVAAYGNLPPQYQQVPLEQLFPALVNSIIDTKLAAAEARKQNLHETEDFKREIASFTERLLGSMIIQQNVEKAVSEDTVKARYAQVVGEMGDQSQVHARHILVKTEDEAKAVIKKLDGGADFADLAKKRSTGPSGANGGDLGFFGKGQMVPAFEKAAFALDKGAVTKAPVQTQFGWHVIKVEDKRSQTPPSLEEMAPQIRQSLAQEAGAAYAQGLREGAKIERFNFDGSLAK